MGCGGTGCGCWSGCSPGAAHPLTPRSAGISQQARSEHSPQPLPPLHGDTRGISRAPSSEGTRLQSHRGFTPYSPHTPRVQSLTAAPQLRVNIQQNSVGKDFAGTGSQLHWSMAPEHGTSQALAVLYPKSKLQPTGTAEGFLTLINF